VFLFLYKILDFFAFLEFFQKLLDDIEGLPGDIEGLPSDA